MTMSNQRDNAAPPPQAVLMQIIMGGLAAQLVHVAARIRVADHLAAGPRTSEELARETGTHAPSLLRALRALASVGVLENVDGGRFALTPVGQLLRSDGPGSLHAYAEYFGRETSARPMAELQHSVTTGETAFDHVFGMGIFAYMGKHPDEAAAFHRRSTAGAARAIDAVVKSYDFSGAGTVVDIGGSKGGMLAGVLGKNPDARGVLFDLPHAVAEAPALLEAANVAGRCSIAPGDFFESVPADGDAYILKSILHDWDDDRCVTILRNCARAMKPAGKILIVERVVPEGRVPADIALTDVVMMIVTGGKERTEREYAALLEAAGLTLTRVISTGTSTSIVEAARR
jgi:hypothetical protein